MCIVNHKSLSFILENSFILKNPILMSYKFIFRRKDLYSLIYTFSFENFIKMFLIISQFKILFYVVPL